MPFCSDHFPGQYKRWCNTLVLSFLDGIQQQTEPLQHEESAFNIWATVSIGDHSFTIYSFLLDQLDLETFWLNAKFLLNYLQLSFFYYFYDSQYKGFRLKPTLKILKLNQYSRRLICVLPSLNITKATGPKTPKIWHFVIISNYFFLTRCTNTSNLMK